MKKLTELRDTNPKDKEAILEIIKKINSQSSIKMDEVDVINILDLEGKQHADFFILNLPIKTDLESTSFTRFLTDLSLEKAKGIAVGILGTEPLKMAEIRHIMNTIYATASKSASVFFSSGTDSDLESGCLLFILATGVTNT